MIDLVAVDAAVARAVAVLDVVLRVVCYVDHPLLTLAAGEVLVDHYSRDGGSTKGQSLASVLSLGTPASQSPTGASGRTGADDVLKAELVVALSNIAVLSSQVWGGTLGVWGRGQCEGGGVVGWEGVGWRERWRSCCIVKRW